MSRVIRKDQIYESFLSDFLKAVLREFSPDDMTTIVDFGANLGWWSLVAASIGYQSVACEISPLNSLYFSKSITSNSFESLITLKKVALSNRNEGKTLCTAKQVKGDHDNVGNTQWKGQVEAPAVARSQALTQTEANSNSVNRNDHSTETDTDTGTERGRKTSSCPPHFLVPIQTLDEIVPVDKNVAVMKADCEGRLLTTMRREQSAAAGSHC